MPFPTIACAGKNMPLNNCKLTEFQKKVFRVVAKIPLGQTRSYQWVAKKIGNPKAVRAVGQALKSNPYPLLIPCHRVIRQDGSPGGYCGKAESSRKKKLLAIEQLIAQKIP